MKDSERLKAMVGLAEIVRDRELAKVEKIVGHMRRIEGDIAQLREARDARLGDDTLDAARLSGADMAWLGWTEDQLSRKLAQLATLRATHEEALKAARQAFGRSDVLGKLAKAAPGKR
ncbi:hypothetical protein [Palleronia sp. LCG004]|uniref:hypothetical protein n=1 Tax=Palleronia sp. LCG004 TaxID=3079304 RepID=UPI002943E127|nr:hypothetical protein [Palleronia sp. LCG004]WOI56186.1 hypothetical protein RVY76_14330 [Palleronia sp. LCG004]